MVSHARSFFLPSGTLKVNSWRASKDAWRAGIASPASAEAPPQRAAAQRSVKFKGRMACSYSCADVRGGTAPPVSALTVIHPTTRLARTPPRNAAAESDRPAERPRGLDSDLRSHVDD